MAGVLRDRATHPVQVCVARALIVASTLCVACPAGSLPCDESPEWNAVCELQAAGGAGGSPSGGAAGTPGLLSAITPVANCAKWPTIGAMDQFFVGRCGLTPSCHGTGTVWTDMQRPNAWERFNKEGTSRANVSCKGGFLAHPTNWPDSVLWTKTRAPTICPPGTTGMAGLTMPPQMTYDPKTPLLSPEEDNCLEGFLRAFASNSGS